MFPTVVLGQSEIDLHKRTPFGPLGFANQVQAGFLRRAVGFCGIALNARANNVFPRRRAATVAGNDVVEIQIFAVKMMAAILTHIFVALKNIVAREFDFFLGQPVVNHQQNNPWNADAEGNRMDRFFVRRIFRKVAPLIEIERAERAVLVVKDDVRLSLKKQSQRAARCADIHGLPKPVQHKHVLVQRDVHIEGAG